MTRWVHGQVQTGPRRYQNMHQRSLLPALVYAIKFRIPGKDREHFQRKTAKDNCLVPSPSRWPVGEVQPGASIHMRQ